jgi:2-polyprenyl-3-methyl-5-hydroxy-6-metoxy-1,4-benzoquinol methylase
VIKKIKYVVKKIVYAIAKVSIELAVAQQGLIKLIKRLREIEPDISKQETSGSEKFNEYWEFKRRSLQAFQCKMMLKAIDFLGGGKITVVDIGDSAGTHMLYLKKLTRENVCVDTIGVNLDPIAIEKIKARGQKAILCRAEELDLGQQKVDLFTSFEMVEHLHNPAILFRRLAKRSACNYMVVTVPYRKQSRVGLYLLRNHPKIMSNTAEEEHIFELSPEDWSLLMLHSGWRVVYDKIYYQYPQRIPIISWVLSLFWRKTDFEGFWGAILKKDIVLSDRYRDWEE